MTSTDPDVHDDLSMLRAAVDSTMENALCAYLKPVRPAHSVPKSGPQANALPKRSSRPTYMKALVTDPVVEIDITFCGLSFEITHLLNFFLKLLSSGLSHGGQIQGKSFW
jgi:hypothetical protein